MDELENGPSRSYYLEVTPPETTIDEQKDVVLIPVAQYTKVGKIDHETHETIARWYSRKTRFKSVWTSSFRSFFMWYM